jgi:D-beta-D-heptose 7-phosphate kinase/D-beta-D-heptose 1-phosphate adenosyltransferase
MARVDLSRKRLSREQAKTVIEGERRAGRRVVFTNGCFDLLHVGHVRYLEEARRKGDVLIVAVNADAAVRALKGAERPILPLDERLRILAALAAVDYVVPFEEPTPHALLRELRPDVLVKGGDYGVEGVVGREIVWEYGGEVCVVPATEGLSTSRTVERIRNERENT